MVSLNENLINSFLTIYDPDSFPCDDFNYVSGNKLNCKYGHFFVMYTGSEGDILKLRAFKN